MNMSHIGIARRKVARASGPRAFVLSRVGLRACPSARSADSTLPPGGRTNVAGRRGIGKHCATTEKECSALCRMNSIFLRLRQKRARRSRAPCVQNVQKLTWSTIPSTYSLGRRRGGVQAAHSSGKREQQAFRKKLPHQPCASGAGVRRGNGGRGRNYWGGGTHRLERVARRGTGVTCHSS